MRIKPQCASHTKRFMRQQRWKKAPPILETLLSVFIITCPPTFQPDVTLRFTQKFCCNKRSKFSFVCIFYTRTFCKFWKRTSFKNYRLFKFKKAVESCLHDNFKFKKPPARRFLPFFKIKKPFARRFLPFFKIISLVKLNIYAISTLKWHQNLDSGRILNFKRGKFLVAIAVLILKWGKFLNFIGKTNLKNVVHQDLYPFLKLVLSWNWINMQFGSWTLPS